MICFVRCPSVIPCYLLYGHEGSARENFSWEDWKGDADPGFLIVSVLQGAELPSGKFSRRVSRRAWNVTFSLIEENLVFHRAFQ